MAKIRKTYVRFVIFDGDVLAVFMRSSARVHYSPSGTTRHGVWVRMAYAHIGQHGDCYDGMQRRKRATPEQYHDLLRELEQIGYQNIEVM